MFICIFAVNTYLKYNIVIYYIYCCKSKKKTFDDDVIHFFLILLSARSARTFIFVYAVKVMYIQKSELETKAAKTRLYSAFLLSLSLSLYYNVLSDSRSRKLNVVVRVKNECISNR